MNGQKILIKIPDIINELIIEDVNSILNSSSLSWTFPVFLYYLNIIKHRQIENIDDMFIINNFSNCDDRIYKYIVDNHNKLNIFRNNNNIIQFIIVNIFSIYNIPNKYILRRLKYLNKLCPNLHEYFNIMIDHCYYIKTILLVPTLMKYYYKSSLNEKYINNIVNAIDKTNSEFLLENNIIFNKKEIFLTIYDLLKTTTEKNLMVISSLFLKKQKCPRNPI
jgi:hypothetical protein